MKQSQSTPAQKAGLLELFRADFEDIRKRVTPMGKALKKQIESKYLKRIEYLVGANNELMKELEQYDDSLTEEESHWKRDMPY